MIDADLRAELLAMRDHDLRVREERLAAGALAGHYDPQMEAVHVQNAARLRAIVAEHGWPAEDLVGQDGSEAAWLIVQHAIGDPDLQHSALQMLHDCISAGRVAPWQAAYLEDRIALYEGRPQTYGTQSLDDPRDGRSRPWTLADPANVNALRASVGLEPIPPIPDSGPDLPPADRENLERNYEWWRAWLKTKGWRTTTAERHQ